MEAEFCLSIFAKPKLSFSIYSIYILSIYIHLSQHIESEDLIFKSQQLLHGYSKAQRNNYYSLPSPPKKNKLYLSQDLNPNPRLTLSYFSMSKIQSINNHLLINHWITVKGHDQRGNMLILLMLQLKLQQKFDRPYCFESSACGL